MKRHLFLVAVVIAATAFLAFAQKLPKPAQRSSLLTEAQQKVMNDGIKLHDAKQYDAAIAVYDKILAENPDATQVIYEKSLSQYTKGDRVKAMETAYVGARYKSDELPLFYGMMANCLDDVGKGDEAIKIYRQAEEMLKSDVGMQHHLSSVYYNLGVTYVRQKNYVDAKTELKKAIEANYAYASPHYLLSVVYNGTKYKVPAFAAAARFVALEFNTQRSTNAAAIVRDVLKPAAKDPNTGNINIFLNMNDPKDEGDYDMYGLFLGTMGIPKDDKDKKKTEAELFVDSVDTLIGLLSEDKKLTKTFVGKNYVPFLTEMKKNGYVKPFGYMVLYIGGNEEAKTWLGSNDAKLGEFMKWAKAYQPPK